MIQSVNTALAGSVAGQTQCPHCGHKGVSGEAVCTQCGQSMYSSTAGITGELTAETDLRNLEAAYEADPSEWEEGSNRTGLQAVAIEAALSADAQQDIDADPPEGDGQSDPTGMDLSKGEEETVRELQERDQEVRKHEQDHITAGGGVVQGGARYTYETGPDGKQYAVGGEVSVEVSSVPGDPDATKDKARAVRRSALAPASPSAQDQNVAAKAAQLEAQARTEEQQNAMEDQDETRSASPLEPEENATSALEAAMNTITQRNTANLLRKNPYQDHAFSVNDTEESAFQEKKSQFIENYV